MTSTSFSVEKYDVSNVDSDYIKGITRGDMYAFISHCQNKQQSAAGTRSRKIVSIRQFWNVSNTICGLCCTKAHILESNVAEVISPCRGKCPAGTKGGRPPARSLETPRIPQRIPQYLSLEESVRLLMVCEKNPRDHCIITIFLNLCKANCGWLAFRQNSSALM